MSGSAALSAAKRRRALNNNEEINTQSDDNKNKKPKQSLVNPLQVLNQHHMKLDILYQRQDKINKQLNITDTDGDIDETSETISDKLNKIEEKLSTSGNKPVYDENELLNKIEDFNNNVAELRKIILNVQSHSINVSLELNELKKKISNNQPNDVDKEEFNEDNTEDN